jgi:hypothetical protein
MDGKRNLSLITPNGERNLYETLAFLLRVLLANIVGMHCDIAVLDDVVVTSNAYTDDGRERVKDQYSLLSSIETVNAQEWVVGTRYHPLDLYSNLVEMVSRRI